MRWTAWYGVLCKSVPRCSSRNGPVPKSRVRPLETTTEPGGSWCCGNIRFKGFRVRGAAAVVEVVVAAVGCGLDVGRGRERRAR